MIFLREWRRPHGDNLIAQVSPVGGMGSWEARVSRLQQPDSPIHVGQHFALLTEAQAAADALVATVYGHTCDATCGPWRPIERREKARDPR
jgi:hypothetical protein